MRLFLAYCSHHDDYEIHLRTHARIALLIPPHCSCHHSDLREWAIDDSFLDAARDIFSRFPSRIPESVERPPRSDFLIEHTLGLLHPK